MPHEVTLYHNPQCSNSRGALALLREKGIEPHIIEYLKTPPNAEDLRNLLNLLEIPAHDLLRSKETEYKTLSLSPSSSDDEIVQAIAVHPVLLQRPIVVHGEKAIIARPPEKVNDIV